MKSSISSALVFLVVLPVAMSQDIATKWTVELPPPIQKASEEEPPQTPIDFEILASRTKRVEISQAPEMADLPPVEGIISLTIQKVTPPELPSAPLPASPSDDPLVVGRLQEMQETFQGIELCFISATVYDNARTLVRIYPNGCAGEEIKAWSNINFNYFSGSFNRYRIIAGDGTFREVGLLMVLGNENTVSLEQLAVSHVADYQAPEIPEMPNVEVGGPTFSIVSGGEHQVALETLEQLHDLYRLAGAALKADFLARRQAYEARKAQLLANPPKPADVTVRVWKRTAAEIQNSQAQEGGAQ